MTAQEIIDFADTITRNSDVNLNNPIVLCFGIPIENAYEYILKNTENQPEYIYAWLEENLMLILREQLEYKIKILETDEGEHSMSIRVGIWDFDLDKIDEITFEPWEIWEIDSYENIYGSSY